jgi:hypothetical protein
LRLWGREPLLSVNLQLNGRAGGVLNYIIPITFGSHIDSVGQ